MLNLKTPSLLCLGVFFRSFFLGCLFAVVGPALALCPVNRFDETVLLARVHDGDTLVLEDGRRVRVLGINAPELKTNQNSGEPLGREAKAVAEAFFAGKKQLRLTYDQQRKDRYGRLLAHVHDGRNRSLAAHLLSQGMALQVVVPPNFSEQSCLKQQEQLARGQGLGVWRHPFWRARPVSELGFNDTGFMRVTGKVTKVSEGQSIWLELDGPLVLHVSAEDKLRFGEPDWRQWEGRHLEVRGWVINRQTHASQKKGFKPLRMDLRSPLSLVESP